MEDKNKNDSFLKRVLRHFVICLVMAALFLLIWQLLVFLFGLGSGDAEEGGEDSAVVYVVPGGGVVEDI